MTDIKVGVLGIGSMGRHHVRNVRETPGLELVAVADPAGDKFGVAGELEVLPDVDALIAAGVEAAVVAVPTGYHHGVGLRLAEAGIHTLIEKPLASTVSQGQEMVRAFHQAQVVGAAGYVERCNPALLELKRRIDAGQLGEIFQITTRRQGPFPVRIADVGVVKDLATHDVDLTAWLAASRHAAIAARTARKSGREHEDLVLATGVLENGVLVNHVVNWFSPFKERVTTVTGEYGAFVADTMNSTLTFFESGTKAIEWNQIAAVRGDLEGHSTKYALDQREPLRVEHENFRDAIRAHRAALDPATTATALDPATIATALDPATHTPGIVTLDDALATLRVLDAMLESARDGRTVEL